MSSANERLARGATNSDEPLAQGASNSDEPLAQGATSADLAELLAVRGDLGQITSERESTVGGYL